LRALRAWYAKCPPAPKIADVLEHLFSEVAEADDVLAMIEKYTAAGGSARYDCAAYP